MEDIDYQSMNSELHFIEMERDKMESLQQGERLSCLRFRRITLKEEVKQVETDE